MVNPMTVAKRGVDYGSSLGADQTEVLIVNEKLTRMEIQ